VGGLGPPPAPLPAQAQLRLPALGLVPLELGQLVVDLLLQLLVTEDVQGVTKWW
jgi:hypothetical protein